MNLTYFSAKYIRSLAIAAILSLAMLFAFMPASVQASSGYGSPCIHRHKVIYGETLSIIAAYHGLPVHRLAKANHLYNSSPIHAGQILIIPIHLGRGHSDHGHSGHGHSGYDNKHAPPKHHYHPKAHHVVQSGDMSSEMVQQHGVSDRKFATEYHVDHADRIRVGQ